MLRRRERRPALNNISLVVEPYVLDHVQLRRFRWRLTATGEPTISSTENFATKREAVQAGEIALQRAIERGCIRPTPAGRPRDPNQLKQGTVGPTISRTR
jgi:hypothetical protein